MEVIETEVEIVDRRRKPFEKTKEIIAVNNYDFAYLSFKYEGYNPDLWYGLMRNSVKTRRASDSGVETDEIIENNELKMWENVAERIKGKFDYDFIYPKQFLR